MFRPTTFCCSLTCSCTAWGCTSICTDERPPILETLPSDPLPKSGGSSGGFMDPGHGKCVSGWPHLGPGGDPKSASCRKKPFCTPSLISFCNLRSGQRAPKFQQPRLQVPATIAQCKGASGARLREYMALSGVNSYGSGKIQEAQRSCKEAAFQAVRHLHEKQKSVCFYKLGVVFWLS